MSSATASDTAPIPVVDPRTGETFGAIPVGSPAEAAALCDRIAATGALGEARSHALSIVEEAKSELPDLPQRRALELVADGVVERYS